MSDIKGRYIHYVLCVGGEGRTPRGDSLWKRHTAKHQKRRSRETPTLYAHDRCPSDSYINRTIITSYFPLSSTNPSSFSPTIQSLPCALVLLTHSGEKKKGWRIRRHTRWTERLGKPLYLGCRRVMLLSPLWLSVNALQDAEGCRWSSSRWPALFFTSATLFLMAASVRLDCFMVTCGITNHRIRLAAHREQLERLIFSFL